MQKILSCKNVCLVDVREEIEFAEFNIGGINIPGHLINEKLDLLDNYDFLIIACSNGTISYVLAKVFKKKLAKKTILHLEKGIF